MKKIRSFLINIVQVTVPTLVVLFLIMEIFFRFGIPAALKPIAVFDEENKVLRSHESRRTTGLYTMGKFAEVKVHWRTNNFGWNSLIDYSRRPIDKPLIAVVGDSFIRALQVDVGKDVSSLLRESMQPNYEVYSFGHDGAPLSQYLHVSRYVEKYFDPDILVFLLIHNDFDVSVANLVSKPYFLQLKVNDDGVEEIQPQGRPLYQFLTYSATFRYLYSNLKLASIYFNLIQDTKDFNANVNVNFIDGHRDTIRQGAEYVLTTLKSEYSSKRLIFMMNAPLSDIHDNQLVSSNVIWINQMVAQLCEIHELECIDLTQAFARDYAQNKVAFNFPMDNHWNAHAHALAAKVLEDYLRHNDGRLK